MEKFMTQQMMCYSVPQVTQMMNAYLDLRTTLLNNAYDQGMIAYSKGQHVLEEGKVDEEQLELLIQATEAINKLHPELENMLVDINQGIKYVSPQFEANTVEVDEGVAFFGAFLKVRFGGNSGIEL
jgi:hypothetical protein